MNKFINFIPCWTSPIFLYCKGSYRRNGKLIIGLLFGELHIKFPLNNNYEFDFYNYGFYCTSNSIDFVWGKNAFKRFVYPWVKVIYKRSLLDNKYFNSHNEEYIKDYNNPNIYEYDINTKAFQEPDKFLFKHNVYDYGDVIYYIEECHYKLKLFRKLNIFINKQYIVTVQLQSGEKIQFKTPYTICMDSQVEMNLITKDYLINKTLF